MGEGKRGCSLRRLRALFAAGTATGLTDGELLERYAARRSESAEAAAAAEMAFAALVDRHGPMVWGVCRRVLGDAHEAEDAFQATFLVLVRKVRSVRVDGSLGRWLYGVAHRVALRARSEAERRRSGIDRVPTRSSHDPVGDVELRDLRDAVSDELDRLPAKYLCPVELCHLQGMTYDQAAREAQLAGSDRQEPTDQGPFQVAGEAGAAWPRARRSRRRVSHGPDRRCQGGRPAGARSIHRPCGDVVRRRLVPGGGHRSDRRSPEDDDVGEEDHPDLGEGFGR
jgi:RNA polymerase sigma factor (sigma-70 family)